MSGETKTEAKRYNLSGTVDTFVVRPLEEGGSWVTFRLLREGERPLRCAAFADKAQAFLSQFSEGSQAQLFGYFETCRWTDRHQTTHEYRRFRVLWSGRPQIRDGAALASPSMPARRPRAATPTGAVRQALGEAMPEIALDEGMFFDI